MGQFPKNMLKSRVCQAACNPKQTPKQTTNFISSSASPQAPLTGSVAKAQYFSPFLENNGQFTGSPYYTFSCQPVIVGVGGGTSSGKTSVCREIIQKLLKQNVGKHAGILSLSQDCFYRNLTTEEMQNIDKFNFDHPDAFDFAEILSTLRKLKAGVPVDIPQYDFVSSQRLKEVTRVEQAEIIFFDGILALYDEEIMKMFDFKIFVEVDSDTRLARRLRRDIVERGRDVLQVLDQYERTVKPSFESYIEPTKKHANIIIPRGAKNTEAIDWFVRAFTRDAPQQQQLQQQQQQQQQQQNTQQENVLNTLAQ
eukprot:TRINITY_DN2878_c1_g2_i1.p1 TRINITY_DN2878_c1_g2~~TRINITY_DN2878_c1_g2_i1.p1  ORF type:complete len:310 (+),score=50.17 TRINITY_DN2878_c1_g2_i1:65-994(+)